MAAVPCVTPPSLRESMASPRWSQRATQPADCKMVNASGWTGTEVRWRFWKNGRRPRSCLDGRLQQLTAGELMEGPQRSCSLPKYLRDPRSRNAHIARESGSTLHFARSEKAPPFGSPAACRCRRSFWGGAALGLFHPRVVLPQYHHPGAQPRTIRPKNLGRRAPGRVLTETSPISAGDLR